MTRTRERQVCVMASDADAACARWKRKGWTVARMSPGPHIDPAGTHEYRVLCVTLHLQQRVDRRRRYRTS